MLTAFPGENHPSVWKAQLKEPGLAEIDHQALTSSRRDRSRLLKGLRAGAIAPGSCRIDRRGRKLEIRFEPERFDLARLLDTAEQALAGKPTEAAAFQPAPQPELLSALARSRVFSSAAGNASSTWPWAAVRSR